MIARMGEAPGRREEHKQATRAALQQAARTLFAEHGFQATTVREIADAAGVTERTFYRYYEGKQDLLAEEALGWVETLSAAIRSRPAREPPLVAVHRALAALLPEIAAESGTRSWLLADGQRPLATLRNSTPRPLLKLENAIAAALIARGQADARTSVDSRSEFRAQVHARVAVAALRSVVLRHRELRGRGSRVPSVGRLLEQAFAALDADS